MAGWKTWVAVIGAIASGVVMIVKGLLSDPMDFNAIGMGIMAILAAFGIGGVGHKVDKLARKMGKLSIIFLLASMLLVAMSTPFALAGDRSFKGLFVPVEKKVTVEPAPALKLIGGTLPVNLSGDTMFRARAGSMDLGIGTDLASYKDIVFLRAEVTEALDPSQVFAGAGLTVNIPSLINMISGTTWKATYINPSIGVIPGWDFKESRFDVGILLSIIQVEF